MKDLKATQPAARDRTRMIYHKNDKCKAVNSGAKDCICWAPAPTPTVQDPLALDAIYAAWYGSGVDIAGGNWDRFVGMLPRIYTTQRPPAAQPAPVPLTHEMRTQMKDRCSSMEKRGAFADGWLSAEEAHGIKESA